MNPERWAEVEAVVLEALDLQSAEREACLKRRCGEDQQLYDEVVSLLALEERSAEFLETPLLETIPERIADYRIVRRLAAGGSAFVYEAIRSGSDERVALKILRGGLFVDEGLLKQSRRETRALTRLRHPGIARILELGRTEDGHQFVAMELVRGRSLDEHLREHALDEEARLEIFRTLCATVEHAHRRGVIHRDLKPSNFMVDEQGRPKLIDFGLARLRGPGALESTLSRPGEVLGTLPYLSPEQAGGRPAEVGERSDVYGLGVILYQLLTDALPFDLTGLSSEEALRVVCSRRPTPPRSRRPGLARDLETIVLQAMHREPARRYQSAAELGEDVDRYLARARIAAQGPGPLQRLQTLVQENKLVSAALITVVCALAVYATTSSVKNAELRAQNRRVIQAERTASAEAENARLEARRARKMLALLEAAIAAMARERSPGQDITLRELLDSVASEVDEGLHGRPREEAELRLTLGRAYGALGYYAEAEAHLREFVELTRADADPEGAKLAAGHQGRGDALLHLGRYDEAIEQYEAARELLRALPVASERLSTVTASLAHALEELGRYEEARASASEALRLTGPQPSEPEEVETAARAHWGLGDIARAEALLREAIEMRTAREGPSTSAARSLADLGRLLAENGRPLEAREPIERALSIQKARLGSEHCETIASRQNLATLLVELGIYEPARAELEEVLAAWRELGLTHHEDYASTLSTLGAVCAELRDHEAAEIHLRAALEAYRRCGSRRSDLLASHLSNLARLLTETGQLDEADALVAEALELRVERFGELHPAVARSIAQLGEILVLRGDLEAAEAAQREALAILEESLPPEHPEIGYARNGLATMLHAAGRLTQAEELYRESLASCRESLGPDHPSSLLRMQNLADLLLESDAEAEAAELLTRALERRRELEESITPTVTSLCVSLARAREALGEGEESLRLLEEALGRLREDPTSRDPELAGVLVMLGRIQLELERHEEALVFLEEAAQLAAPGGAAAREAGELGARARRTP